MAEKKPTSAELKDAAEMTAEAQLRRTGEIGEPVMVNGKTLTEWLSDGGRRPGEYTDIRLAVLLSHVRRIGLDILTKEGS